MSNAPQISPADSERLLTAARQARQQAYAPYSNFTVGAALITSQGKLFTGCNAEINSYEEATCAERNAIANAITQGAAQHGLDFIKAIAVSTIAAKPSAPISDICPCGVCRQVISDFCVLPHCVVVMDDAANGQIRTMSSILPDAFVLRRPAKMPPAVNCDLLEQQALANPHTGNLLEIAKAIRANAARQVENRPEGAVILTTDGRAFCGASVENSCTPLLMRALRVASNRAIAQGAAKQETAFISRIVLALPAIGLSEKAMFRQALNPALLTEFCRDDADITIQIDGKKPLTFKCAELFTWIDKLQNLA